MSRLKDNPQAQAIHQAFLASIRDGRGNKTGESWRAFNMSLAKPFALPICPPNYRKPRYCD